MQKEECFQDLVGYDEFTNKNFQFLAVHICTRLSQLTPNFSMREGTTVGRTVRGVTDGETV